MELSEWQLQTLKILVGVVVSTTNSQASVAALSRLLPNNAVATPYQRSHVTPDLKPGLSIVGGVGSGMPQLHPGLASAFRRHAASGPDYD